MAKRFCDRSVQFLVNCFDNIVMEANNSGLNSTYLLLSEERREREKKGREEELYRRRANEEDRQRGVNVASGDLFTDI